VSHACFPSPLPASRRERATNGRPGGGAAGFTLIELLVVLAILGLVVALVTPQVLKYLGRAKIDAAHLQIENLSGALDLFKLDMQRYPTQQEGLEALIQPPLGASGWSGPYLKQKSVPLDPWGRAYSYRIPGEHGEYDLYSLGASNALGGTGENQAITNW